MIRRGLLTLLAAAGLAVMAWTFLSPWADIMKVGRDVYGALWTLPPIIGVHLFQLFLSSVAWRGLFADTKPATAFFFRLRLIREGIDSLLPVAQIGGEVIGARMLAKTGLGGASAGASVIVDMSMEVLAQAIFLLTGVAVLSMTTGGWTEWLGPAALAAAAACGFLLAQRFGLLRLLEMLTRRIGARLPGVGDFSLQGLDAAATGFYRRRRAVLRAGLCHFASWSIGTIESWIVLRALGVPASLAQALVVESLGMAARTAGFAVPGAIAVQEGGFALAAMAVGLPDTAGLAVSLAKRAREVLVGAAGVALAWRAGGFR